MLLIHDKKLREDRMSIIKEQVTQHRVICCANSFSGVIDDDSYTEVGEEIDTADYQDGVWFTFSTSGDTVVGSGTISFSVLLEHSDTSGDGYVPLGKENLIYGRDDGILPVPLTQSEVTNGTFVAREGVRSTKRYVRASWTANITSPHSDWLVSFTILAFVRPVYAPTPSDAVYSA